MTFVALHELAHLADENYGHNESFWRYFKTILEEAVAFGIYIPVDYGKTPDRYCGLLVQSNPLYTNVMSY